MSGTRWKFSALVLATVFFAGCDNGSNRVANLGPETQTQNQNDPFCGPFGCNDPQPIPQSSDPIPTEFDQLLEPTTTTSSGTGINPVSSDPIQIGSAPDGGLNQQDTNNIRTVLETLARQGQFEDNSDVFSPQLLSRAQELLNKVAEAEPNSPASSAISAEMLVLMGQMIESCLKKVERLVPKPFQPGVGIWKGKGKHSDLTFEIKQTSRKGTFLVTRFGETVKTPSSQKDEDDRAHQNGNFKRHPDGTVQARADGSGLFRAGPWVSTGAHLTDLPSAARGMLHNPNWSSNSKSGQKEKNEVEIHLVQSNNPIPQHYRRAVRRIGSCLSTAIGVTNPIYARTLNKLDPQTRTFFMRVLLGIK